MTTLNGCATRIAAIAFAIAAGTQASATNAAELQKVTIMVGGITKLIYLPARLTEQLGYFKAEGLEVELLSQPAGVDAENELLAGAVQAVVGFYDHSIDLQAKGKDVKAIVVFGGVPGEVEMVATKSAGSIKSMADVKGKTLGVTGLGSSTNFLTQYLAHLKGIPSSQYSVLPVGADNSFIAAIKQGRIDAGMTTEPTVSQLLKTGDAQVLVDMRSVEGTRAALGGAYPASSLYVQSAWLDTHKEEGREAGTRVRPYLAVPAFAQCRGDCRADAEGLLRQRQGALCKRAEVVAPHVHDGRENARGRS